MEGREKERNVDLGNRREEEKVREEDGRVNKEKEEQGKPNEGRGERRKERKK